jgi:hypothetical protein
MKFIISENKLTDIVYRHLDQTIKELGIAEHEGYLGKNFFIGDNNPGSGFVFYLPDFHHEVKTLHVYQKDSEFFNNFVMKIFGETGWRPAFEIWFITNYPQYEVNEFIYQN